MTSPTPATNTDGTPTVVDFALVKEILVRTAGLPAEPITPDASQVRAGIDSMALTVLSMALEDTAGLIVPESVLAQAPTVAALVDLAAAHAAARPC